MVFKNTPNNASLASRISWAITKEPFFKPMVDTAWNSGKDIRVEVSAVYAPFIVLTELNDENGVDVSIRITQDKLSVEEIEELKPTLDSVEKLNARLNQILEDFEPEV